ncbi:hypothetical protein HUJ04_008008 [Dendroctonus ponderosae]|nr:hypothetical protein HUJ04_008008 [Dendroctonus ponderosae]
MKGHWKSLVDSSAVHRRAVGGCQRSDSPTSSARMGLAELLGNTSVRRVLDFIVNAVNADPHQPQPHLCCNENTFYTCNSYQHR